MLEEPKPDLLLIFGTNQFGGSERREIAQRGIQLPEWQINRLEPPAERRPVPDSHAAERLAHVILRSPVRQENCGRKCRKYRQSFALA